MSQRDAIVGCLVLGALLAGNAGRAREALPPAPGSPSLSAQVAPEPTANRAAMVERAAALLSRWAPVFVQQVSPEHPERDRPLRVDFDGDWDATNNWAHLDARAAGATPTVYGSAILSETHAYLNYVLFYPRDWLSWLCVPYACHDNDLETALVVVERGGAARPDRLVFVETKTHYRYLALPGADVARGARGQPIFVVESEGHGLHALGRGETSGGARLVLVHGAATPPLEDAGVTTEQYELLSLADTLWPRRAARAVDGKLWSEGETGFLYYTGARMGRRGSPLGASMASREYPGGVRPPWALHAAGERGDWFLDPAYAAQTRHGEWLQASASRNYVFNPYLDDLTRECRGADCPSAPPPPNTLARSSLTGGLLLALGSLYLRSRRRVPGAASKVAPQPLQP